MKSTISSSALMRLCLRGVISTSLYWTVRKIRKKKKVMYERQYFDINLFEDDDCLHLFRFRKIELITLYRSFKIPKLVRLIDRNVYTGIEAFCIMLRRMAYPNRLLDLSRIFKRDPTSISRVTHWMLAFIFNRFHERVTRLSQPWILNNLEFFAERCVEAGSYYNNLVGFIDGTGRPICRPKRNQKEQYSGYKKMHLLKYQSVLFPNGMIGRLDGPFNGRRHDAAILHLSGLLNEMKNSFVLPDGRRFVIYGDPGYTNQAFIKVGYKNYNKLNEQQKTFNREMSALRVSVEYGFGKIIQQFAFLDYRKNQKLLLQPLKKMYYVGAILANCQICFRGSQVSKYFQCPAPTLDEYLHGM